jgi:methylthioribose-1-phosphate isomerase
MLDQTALPLTLRYVDVTTAGQMAEAIEAMIIRGAPAIGVAAAFGMVLSARTHAKCQTDMPSFQAALRSDSDRLGATRPTAVNLMWALDGINRLIDSAPPTMAITDLLHQLEQAAHRLYADDVAINQAIGQHGASLLPTGAKVLTHCNAGALATAGHGTALGVIRTRFAQDPTLTVYADETRPRLQGAKLTVWELQQAGIPVTLLTDGMSGSLMRDRGIDAVIVGADRIAANGDTANKIGTYNLAIVAKHHGVPFYVAAPWSTLDITLPEGSGIPIEYRSADEVRYGGGAGLITPADTVVYNPGFDVTPASLITAIITERAVHHPPFDFGC